jgi:predicted DNA-binding transcriptional regulator AlpA
MFPKVEIAKAIQPTIIKQEISFDPANCYTIGEISQKYGISLSTVDKTIRKNSIPKKQIGKFVYVPKVEIDRLFAHK